jgi:hypothetical protein
MTTRHHTRRLALGAVVLAFVATLTGTSAASADIPAGPTAWTSSGVATNTVTSDGTTGTDPSFSYNTHIASCGYCGREWVFQTTATQDGTLPLTWNYHGFHAWYQARGYIYGFVNHNGVRTNYGLASGYVSGGFNWNGSFTPTVAAGDTYGFVVGGRHFDSNGTLSGTLTVHIPDTTAPELTVPADVTATATSASGAMVTLPAATATDAVDGAVTPDCDQPDGTTTQFPLGTTVVTCTATDAAGNTSPSQSFNVTVTYPWSGFMQPVNADGTSVFKAGSTVPVKFALTGADGPLADAVGTLSYAKVSSGVDGTYVESASTAAATTGSQFRYDDGKYIFNWSTKGLSAGTYKLSANLGDGVSHTVQISLK